MKKLLLVLLGLIMIFSMVFLFSGCEVVKDLQEQAELAAKAINESGFTDGYLAIPKTPIPSEGDVSGSIYVKNGEITVDNNVIKLSFSNEQYTVEDENSHKVTVILNGTINFGFEGNLPTLKIVAYSTGINIKVGDEDMGNVGVDILSTFSSDGSGNYSVSIKGSVGSYDVTTSMTIPGV